MEMRSYEIELLIRYGDKWQEENSFMYCDLHKVQITKQYESVNTEVTEIIKWRCQKSIIYNEQVCDFFFIIHRKHIVIRIKI